MNSSDNNIQVSVCVVTYNQEKYIVECLDSLVTQQTNFKFEIIIGEDCSTDNTRAIVQQYIEKYPDLIIPVFHTKNVGAVQNIKQAYEKAKGKYIAHMDGDDMALPGKLQKQFDIMENNTDVIICSHNMIEIIDNSPTEKSYWNYPEGKYTIVDLIRNLPFFAHSSKFFRVNNDAHWSNALNDYDTLDMEFHLYQASMGSIYHLEENLGCYRVDVGVSAIKDGKLNHHTLKRITDMYEKLIKTHPDMENEIKKSYALHLLSTANKFAVIESDSKKMKEYTFRSLKQGFFYRKQAFMFLLAFSPYLGATILKYRYKLKSSKKDIKNNKV